MKKVISLIFTLLIISQLKAQPTPWINQGATWFYKWEGISSGGNDKIEYTHDTVISGITCQVLKTTRYTYVVPGPGQPIVLASSDVLPYNFTYSNGDTVFYYHDNRFDVLYNFGSQPGQHWNLGVDTNDFKCSASIVKVDSLDTKIINTQSYRVLNVSDSTDSSQGFYGSIMEHVGSMNYLFPLDRNCDSIIVDFYYFRFSCFEDSSMDYKVVIPDECQNPYHVGINETKDSKRISLSPNPATDKLYVNLNDNGNYQICVYNIFGQKLIETDNNSSRAVSIELQTLNRGVYMITLTNDIGKVITDTFVKQ